MEGGGGPIERKSFLSKGRENSLRNLGKALPRALQPEGGGFL